MTGWEPRSEFLRELYAEARAEARATALVEGKELNLRSNVGDLLRHRFGALSPEHEARLQSASFDTLQGWFKAALTAPSIDAVLVD